MHASVRLRDWRSNYSKRFTDMGLGRGKNRILIALICRVKQHTTHPRSSQCEVVGLAACEVFVDRPYQQGPQCFSFWSSLLYQLFNRGRSFWKDPFAQRVPSFEKARPGWMPDLTGPSTSCVQGASAKATLACQEQSWPCCSMAQAQKQGNNQAWFCGFPRTNSSRHWLSKGESPSNPGSTKPCLIMSRFRKGSGSLSV